MLFLQAQKKDRKTLLLTNESLRLKLVFIAKARGEALESRQNRWYIGQRSLRKPNVWCIYNTNDHNVAIKHRG
jgi:hypothetical protein